VRVQGVSEAFSKAYHKVDVRQKLVEVCRRACWWLMRRCSRVQAVDVYTVARDVRTQCPLLDHILTTSHGLVVDCDHHPPVTPSDNLFLSVFLLSHYGHPYVVMGRPLCFTPMIHLFMYYVFRALIFEAEECHPAGL